MPEAQISYSQSGEDIIMLFLAQHVLHLPTVYYLDLGANEPKKFNNTQLFYENGYRGVSVDANSYFKALFESERPEDTFVVCGVGKKNGEATFYEIDPHTLSTFSKQEAEQYTSNGQHTLIREKNCQIYTVETIIEKFCKQQPNLLSLDVEGLDLQVLESIDFNTWRPAIICVETLTYTIDSKEQKIKEIIDLLQSKNYMLYADTYINSIFVDKQIWEKRK